MSLNFIANTSFSIAPMTGPDIPVKELENPVQSFRNGLDKLDVQHAFHSEQFESYLDEFKAMMAPVTVSVAQYGSWLIPRSVVQKNNGLLTDSTSSAAAAPLPP